MKKEIAALIALVILVGLVGCGDGDSVSSVSKSQSSSTPAITSSSYISVTDNPSNSDVDMSIDEIIVAIDGIIAGTVTVGENAGHEIYYDEDTDRIWLNMWQDSARAAADAALYGDAEAWDGVIESIRSMSESYLSMLQFAGHQTGVVISLRDIGDRETTLAAAYNGTVIFDGANDRERRSD